MGENMTGVTSTGVESGSEPVATSSSSLLNMEDNSEAGGSLSTSRVLKRKRSDPDIVRQEGTTTPSGSLFLRPKIPFLT
jgi:hypothetical protein